MQTATNTVQNDKVAKAAAAKARKAEQQRLRRAAAKAAKSKPGQGVDLELDADEVHGTAPVKASKKTKESATRGAVKEAILAAADAAYKKAGGAKLDAKGVLALRVGVMDDLAQDGIKRTTASCMLGEWQKTLPAHQRLAARK